MRYEIFTVPISDPSASAELNRFLASKRVLAVHREFVQNGSQSCWCFCVEYLEGEQKVGATVRRKRVDYKEVLGEEEFGRFARMRARRKELAEAEGFPAYAVCTDEQLAAMARTAELTPLAIKAVEGFGEAKFRKYGEALMAAHAGGKEAGDAPGGEAV